MTVGRTGRRSGARACSIDRGLKKGAEIEK